MVGTLMNNIYIKTGRMELLRGQDILLFEYSVVNLNTVFKNRQRKEKL